MESKNGECQNSIQHCLTNPALNTHWAQSWLEFESELYQKSNLSIFRIAVNSKIPALLYECDVSCCYFGPGQPQPKQVTGILFLLLSFKSQNTIL